MSPGSRSGFSVSALEAALRLKSAPSGDRIQHPHRSPSSATCHRRGHLLLSTGEQLHRASRPGLDTVTHSPGTDAGKDSPMAADTATAAGAVGTAGIHRLWQKLSRQPLGRWLFTQGVCFKAPYFRTVHPRIRELRPGLCRVRAPNRRGVRNHIGTYHAIASCNMAEIAAGVMTEATVPPSHRWIPSGMTVDYNAKATTGVTAIARLDRIPEFDDDPFDLVVPVDVLD